MSQYIWICPKCRHQFQGHVFDEGTFGSGPICNTCCVELEFLAVEDAADEPAFKKRNRGKQLRTPHSTSSLGLGA